jgi:response regulator RpfG family c-di-GMP phosphodiesterase
MIEKFRDEGETSAKFRVGDMVCACDISTFSIRRDGVVQGYLFEVRDATQEQRALDILSDFNERLNHEVSDKTSHIEQMQRKIVLGMANMIENRDSNTGGHVKRTSDVIQILVQEIRAQGYIPLDDTLAHDIVRAAPMHDLGKISIDSSILNKPGRLTEEEYAIMKTHSTTSGEMVMILLDGVEEEHFVKTAFHVARYHHERWDGRGYPEGLVGEMIPLEARIMAVADVYDALVSKRVYKEPMSFEMACKIMCEGMGTQFDPNMLMIFLGCREKLEAYYATAE